MPTVHEKPTTDTFSVTTRDRRLRREFFVKDCPEQGDAEAAVIEFTPAIAPSFAGILIRQSIEAKRESGADWSVTVDYGPGDISEAIGATPPEARDWGPTDALDSSWSFDTNSQSVHVTQAKETTYRRQATDGQALVIGTAVRPPLPDNEPGTAPNEGLAIGLSKDRVEGCDIHVPALRFSRTIKRANVTLAYLNAALYGLVGKTNKERFYFFDPGEVLYLGATGNHTDAKSDGWTITHHFAASPNQTNLKFGGPRTEDIIKIPRKGGWEYVWVSYRWRTVNFPTYLENGTLADAAIMVQVPAAVYCQKVYEEGDFNLLGVGGAEPANVEAKAKQKKAAGRWMGDWPQGRAVGLLPPNDPGDGFNGAGGDF